MIERMKSALVRLHRDEDGRAIEKVLIVALIALPIIVLLVLFRNEIVGWFEEGHDELKEAKDK